MPTIELELDLDELELLDALLASSEAETPQSASPDHATAAVAGQDVTLAQKKPPARTQPGIPDKKKPKSRLAPVIPLPPRKRQAKPETPKSRQGNDRQKETDTASLFRPARRFIPKLRLLGVIHEIIADGGSYHIRHEEFPDIEIWPSAGLFHCAEDLRDKVELFRRPWNEFRLEPMKKHPPANLTRQCCPLLLLRYLATLHGSEGRLLLNIDPQAVLTLRSPLNCELFNCTPLQQRLARYLQDYPSTLRKLAMTTRTPIPEVIDFTNACREIGLIAEVEPTLPTEQMQQKHGLLHNLRRRLGWLQIDQKENDDGTA